MGEKLTAISLAHKDNQLKFECQMLEKANAVLLTILGPLRKGKKAVLVAFQYTMDILLIKK